MFLVQRLGREGGEGRWNGFLTRFVFRFFVSLWVGCAQVVWYAICLAGESTAPGFEVRRRMFEVERTGEWTRGMCVVDRRFVSLPRSPFSLLPTSPLPIPNPNLPDSFGLHTEEPPKSLSRSVPNPESTLKTTSLLFRRTKGSRSL